MALRRFLNIKKRLMKNSEMVGGFKARPSTSALRRVTYIPTEKNSSKKYYLSHFPAVKPELTKTEIRIVFDPSAKCDGVSLNNAIHQGPKMQRAL